MATEWAKGLLALLLLSALLYPILGIAEWQGDTPAQENMPGIATGLFDTWLFPFEVLSVLLLAALVGALYMSQKREPEEPQ